MRTAEMDEIAADFGLTLRRSYCMHGGAVTYTVTLPGEDARVAFMVRDDEAQSVELLETRMYEAVDAICKFTKE